MYVNESEVIQAPFPLCVCVCLLVCEGESQMHTIRVLHKGFSNVSIVEEVTHRCSPLKEKSTLGNYIQNSDVRQEHRCFSLFFAFSRSLDTRPTRVVLHVQ